MRTGPGLAKVRRVPITMRREKSLVATLQGALRTWLDRADVVSEGSGVSDRDRIVYYGTTSILLPWMEMPADRDSIAAIAHDPHLRVRALRIARREAEARAGARLGVMRAEISTEATARGLCLRIEIDVTVRKSSSKSSALHT